MLLKQSLGLTAPWLREFQGVRMTHALVIGAGVAGPVMAVALQRVGIETTVFERDPAGAEQRGSWITFQANGMDALRAIDAADLVEKLGYDVETISFINGKSRTLGRMPMAAPRADGQLSQMMRRADLYTAMAELAREHGAHVRYGKELVGAALIAAPILAVVANTFGPGEGAWRHLVETVLAAYVRNTLLLLGAV